MFKGSGQGTAGMSKGSGQGMAGMSKGSGQGTVGISKGSGSGSMLMTSNPPTPVLRSVLKLVLYDSTVELQEAFFQVLCRYCIGLETVYWTAYRMYFTTYILNHIDQTYK